MRREQQVIREHKDRLRIFVIIYFFSEKYTDPENPSRKRLLQSEIKIQKIDFLLRNPDYFSFELLKLAEEESSKKTEIKSIVRNIFEEDEPTLRKLEMQKFFYGAYEEIDDVIAFLKGFGFIEFSSRKSSGLTTIEKNYFVTDLAIKRVENQLSSFDFLSWYFDRCKLIKKYFGDLSGSDLGKSQYEIEEYRNTSFQNYIAGIEEKVTKKFNKLYGEQL